MSKTAEFAHVFRCTCGKRWEVRTDNLASLVYLTIVASERFKYNVHVYYCEGGQDGV